MQLLPSAQLAINSSYSNVLQATPDDIALVVERTDSLVANEFVEKIRISIDKVKERLTSTKEKMKEREDKKRMLNDIQ